MDRKSSIFKITTVSVFLLLNLISYQVSADFIGVYAGAGIWQQTPSGHINNQGTNADMEKNFLYGEENANFVYVAIEHPFPLIPNIRVNMYNLEMSKTTTLTAANAFTFAGTSYTAGTSIQSKFEWQEEDALLYYEFLDNIVSFDLGLGMKTVTAELSITSGGVTNTLEIEESLPIAYAMAGVHIVGTGISIIVEQTTSFGGSMEISQSSSKLVYETDYMLGVELGYRTTTTNLDDMPIITGEVEFSGPFANLLFHF
ncbi:MAG: TIGR04219 family outer membrane beta-barrel protein [Gammaproteobacteria bacterium]|nr:TIGR04219 family outer membrane beta-barrel protein [Gammaproteobacteria bacterium]